MAEDGQTIELEVVEIDGVSLPPKSVGEEAGKAAPWAQWGNWQGRVTRLDARWWPLWIVLGFIALVVFVAVGMVAAVLFVVFRILAGIARLFQRDPLRH